MTDDELRDAVLVELNIDPAAATDLQKSQAARKVKASKAKVLLYLNRDTFDTYDVVVTELERNDSVLDPAADCAWLPDPHWAFPDRAQYVSNVPNTDDPTLFDVTYRIGLDLADPDCEPVNEFIIADAAAALRFSPSFADAPRAVTSVNSGGQSISFEKAPGSADAAGGDLTVGTLARFKRYTIGKAFDVSQAPWPYDGTQMGRTR
jgi:hypothetical protein